VEHNYKKNVADNKGPLIHQTTALYFVY